MKIELLQKTVPEKCGYLIKNPLNRFYLTGFRSSAGTLLVTRDRCVLLVDFRYYEMAKKAVSSCEVVLMTQETKQLAELTEKIEKIYVEIDYVSLQLYQSFKKALPSVEISKSDRLMRKIGELRICKEESEIAKIRACQQLTDAAFDHVLTQIKPGITEREIAFILDTFIRKEGAQGTSFDTIALTGPNTSLPHGVPGDRVAQAGDFVLMDFGVYMDGYCSDMTRTVALSHITDEQKFVYETVLTAQKKALDAIKIGAVCGDVDAAARNFIENERGFAGCFGHGLGHGVGVEIHETPVFSPRSTTLLEKGMIITVEPGVYLEGKFGVRIEDFVVMTNDGYENFTKSPKELIIL